MRAEEMRALLDKTVTHDRYRITTVHEFTDDDHPTTAQQQAGSGRDTTGRRSTAARRSRWWRR